MKRETSKGNPALIFYRTIVFRNRGVTEATYFKQLYIRVAIVAGNLRIDEDLLSKYDLTRLIFIERTSENLDKESFL